MLATSLVLLPYYILKVQLSVRCRNGPTSEDMDLFSFPTQGLVSQSCCILPCPSESCLLASRHSSRFSHTQSLSTLLWSVPFTSWFSLMPVPLLGTLSCSPLLMLACSIGVSTDITFITRCFLVPKLGRVLSPMAQLCLPNHPDPPYLLTHHTFPLVDFSGL